MRPIVPGRKAGGSNVANFRHEPFEDLVLEAKLVSKQSERTDLYKKAQVVFEEQALTQRLRCEPRTSAVRRPPPDALRSGGRDP